MRSAASSECTILTAEMWHPQYITDCLHCSTADRESCGIAVSETNGPKGKVTSYKGMGLVNEVFTEENLEPMHGDIGVGHVRYSTAGASTRENAQPLVLNYVKGTLALAHNGNLINAAELRHDLEYTGAIFQTTIDSEVIAYHIARERLKSSTVEEQWGVPVARSRERIPLWS